ncbi:phosphoribosylformylglycinamidine synthase II [Fimbriimonas ginsengisoli Gsoil 348]|uniref:Phosphoribosylformylglycinamidine synthase subunit PurL n=2 Tax=Fimbriimonas ginsengisoli TaxID=1005039 RepID=A0A068NYM6_FIMGI|nr:phosphoribosylformylglycinamidine synthase II [Fimbriimonas ginsengisoli Gsoil 348]
MGLNADEYALILTLLGREPSYTELGMFAVMWSEHCGYKYSRPVLAYFKQYKEAMEGDGLENAGIVDIGEGLGVTMKVESHNHPSAVEPYQGAATGVGGIIRDILTMGARPIAGLNSLRFGPIRDGEGEPSVIERNRYLFEHVVAGIAGYGNCVGVPTVAGEVNFHPRYSGNPLVNAMCVGVLRLDEVTTAGATGTGNPVIYLGSATGKDGIHGATFASDALGEDNEAKRPNVQIGDPFAEKLLIEATLEALKTGAIVAIQDMGAAGLTCSTIEMASKGEVGMTVDLDLVPMREDDMTGYELMLSESQERMLCVAEKGREGEVLDVFRKWGLKAEVIGHVTDDGIVTVTRHGRIEAQVDPKLLTDHCPVYKSRIEEPEYFRRAANFDPSQLPEVDLRAALLKLLSSPDVASKRWVFEQYDQQVQTQTSLAFGAGDAAVLAPRGTKKGLALKIDGNARQAYLHPYRGGLLAVVEAARNVACTGAKPTAVTDGLNFGNPTYPHVYWQFDRAVKGIADAAEAMGTPVISGNVSFYNESDLGEVPPTPLIGMLGILEDVNQRVGLAPQSPTNLFLLEIAELEAGQAGLGASLFLSELHDREDGYPEAPFLDGERRIQQALVDGVAAGVILSAHDSSEGGLAVALAEIALHSGVSAALPEGPTLAAALFGEIPGRVVVGASDASKIESLATHHQLRLTRLGTYGSGEGLRLTLGGLDLAWSSEELRTAYESAIPQVMIH